MRRKLQIIKHGKVASWVWIALATTWFLVMMVLPFVPGRVGQQAIAAWSQAGGWLVMGYSVILGTYASSRTIQRVKGVAQEMSQIQMNSGPPIPYPMTGSIGEEDL